MKNAKLIEARGKMSRKEVCAAVDISLSALTMYELGSRVPRDAVKKRLADFYGKSIEELFF